MHRIVKRRPSVGAILGFVALFVTLSGAAIAVEGPPGKDSVGHGELVPKVSKQIRAPGPRGPQGPPGVVDLEADGPYPGATDLGDLPDQGDNSDELWANGGSRQTSWVQCAPGKIALGGGYHLAADAGDASAKAVQVVVSEPTQVEDGETLYDDPALYKPIPGDAAGSIVPNGWIVQGFNTGAAPVVVRPWVVCADVELE